MHPFEDLVIPPKSLGIHWFGQSSFGLKSPEGTIVLTDPYFPRHRPPDQFIHPTSPLDEAFLHTDFVVLTHNHGDHTCLETIGRIDAAHPDVCFIGPPESAAALREAGIRQAAITSVTAGDKAAMGSMTVHTVWAKPPEGVPGDNIEPPDVQHLAFVVDSGGVRLFVSGDPINTFANHESLLKPIRDLQPEVGLLTNHPTEGEFPFFDGSAKMANELGLKTAVPAHYGCFVRRDYDPHEWARHLPPDGPKALIVPYNQSVIYSNEV